MGETVSVCFFLCISYFMHTECNVQLFINKACFNFRSIKNTYKRQFCIQKYEKSNLSRERLLVYLICKYC